MRERNKKRNDKSVIGEAKDFKLKKVWLKDGDLYGLASNEVRRNFKFKFCPIGDSTFGRRDGDAIVTFGDGFCIIDNITCQKL